MYIFAVYTITKYVIAYVPRLYIKLVRTLYIYIYASNIIQGQEPIVVVIEFWTPSVDIFFYIMEHVSFEYLTWKSTKFRH